MQKGDLKWQAMSSFWTFGFLPSACNLCDGRIYQEAVTGKGRRRPSPILSYVHTYVRVGDGEKENFIPSTKKNVSQEMYYREIAISEGSFRVDRICVFRPSFLPYLYFCCIWYRIGWIARNDITGDDDPMDVIASSKKEMREEEGVKRREKNKFFLISLSIIFDRLSFLFSLETFFSKTLFTHFVIWILMNIEMVERRKEWNIHDTRK